jgi:hypothetical protein
MSLIELDWMKRETRDIFFKYLNLSKSEKIKLMKQIKIMDVEKNFINLLK